jgi:hypothetical protein
MSPSKKKAAKKTAKKSSAKAKAVKTKKKAAMPKKKAAPKKKAKPAKSVAKKTTAKKAAKATAKSGARKAPVKTASKKAAKAPAKKAAAKAKSTAKKATAAAVKPSKPSKPSKPAKKKETKAKAAKAPKRARAKKLVTPTGPRHPKLGYKWACYGCGAKFYDLGKEDPICPKCETDQRDKPLEDTKPIVATPKPKVVRPMAQLLDDEDPTVNPEEDARTGNAVQTEKEIFDDAESASADVDIDDVETSSSVEEPPEIDAP